MHLESTFLKWKNLEYIGDRLSPIALEDFDMGTEWVNYCLVAIKFTLTPISALTPISDPYILEISKTSARYCLFTSSTAGEYL